MARFDVHPMRGRRGYLLDCQTDYLTGLDTRLMVPLFLLEDFPQAAARLNPRFRVEQADVVMMTQYAAALERRVLGPPIASLAEEHYAIMNALDMLLNGY